MSINITVNGKIDKNYRPLNPLFNDPQKIRREQENQRRKLRIIQVREAAKHVAKTIRNNVAAERRRCLSNNQKKKAEEMNKWRKEKLAKENKAFTTACNEIGQAHRAACQEKHIQAAQTAKKNSYKQFKRIISNAKRKPPVSNVSSIMETFKYPNKETKVKKIISNAKKEQTALNICTCTEALKCPDKETKCVCTQTIPRKESMNNNNESESTSSFDEEFELSEETFDEFDDEGEERREFENELENEGAYQEEYNTEYEYESDSDYEAKLKGIYNGSSDSSDDSDDRNQKGKHNKSTLSRTVFNFDVDSQDEIETTQYKKHNEHKEKKKNIHRIPKQRKRNLPEEEEEEEEEEVEEEARPHVKTFHIDVYSEDEVVISPVCEKEDEYLKHKEKDENIQKVPSQEKQTSSNEERENRSKYLNINVDSQGDIVIYPVCRKKNEYKKPKEKNKNIQKSSKQEKENLPNEEQEARPHIKVFNIDVGSQDDIEILPVCGKEDKYLEQKEKNKNIQKASKQKRQSLSKEEQEVKRSSKFLNTYVDSQDDIFTSAVDRKNNEYVDNKEKSKNIQKVPSQEKQTSSNEERENKRPSKYLNINVDSQGDIVISPVCRKKNEYIEFKEKSKNIQKVPSQEKQTSSNEERENKRPSKYLNINVDSQGDIVISPVCRKKNEYIELKEKSKNIQKVPSQEKENLSNEEQEARPHIKVFNIDVGSQDDIEILPECGKEDKYLEQKEKNKNIQKASKQKRQSLSKEEQEVKRPSKYLNINVDSEGDIVISPVCRKKNEYIELKEKSKNIQKVPSQEKENLSNEEQEARPHMKVFNIDVGSQDDIEILPVCGKEDKYLKQKEKNKNIQKASKQKKQSLLEEEQEAILHVKSSNIDIDIDSQEESNEEEEENIQRGSETKKQNLSEEEDKAEEQTKLNPQKRFSTISNLIMKQNEAPVYKEQTSTKKEEDKLPTDTSKTFNVILAPSKTHTTSNSYQSTTDLSYQKTVSQHDKLSSYSICNQSPRKRSADLCGNYTHKIQSYDCNRRTSKAYQASVCDCFVNRHQDYAAPNAMEQALREKEFVKKQLQKALEKNKMCEKRGKRALEREQIRQDYKILTQKLEVLACQFPRQASNFNNNTHIFTDKGLRNERNLNTTVEGFLNKPEIVTDFQGSPKKNKTAADILCNPGKAMNNELNLGDECAGAGGTKGVRLENESCSSILLGCIDEQNVKVSQNNPKQGVDMARLENLIQQLSGLQKCLSMGLTANNQNDCEKENTNVQNILSCINKLCDESKNILSNERKDAVSSQPNGKTIGQEPVEILITVKGDRNFITVPSLSAKKYRKTSALPRGVQAKKPLKPVKKNQYKKIPVESTITKILHDSNSTSYRSLPSQISPKMDKFMNKEGADQPMTPLEERRKHETPRLNPLVAQYVQRLLSMSRCAIKDLGISSSDIPTPSSSIMNTPSNMESTSDSLIMSSDRLISVQKFLEDSHSFVRELEETLCAHSSATVIEENLRRIWHKRFLTSEGKPTEKRIEKETSESAETSNKQEKHKEQNATVEKDNRKGKEASTIKVNNRKRPQSSQNVQTKRMIDKAIETQNSADLPNMNATKKLSESCAQRIAELTELINRVRTEKQRLLEMTLSSISENGRQSTEYAELPNENEGNQKSDDTIKSENKYSEKTNLQETQPFAASRDSGIHESRPATAQENLIEEESSAALQKDKQTTVAQRRSKPPPTITRVSPELMEDTVPHELSTILEVDTPGPSQMNINAPLDNSNRVEKWAQPVPFPTFEEYVKNLNLDIDKLNANQIQILEEDFSHYLDLLEQSQKDPEYNEFPSIKTYMKKHGYEQPSNLSEMNSGMSENNNHRISTIAPDMEFPKFSKYLTISSDKSDTKIPFSSSTNITNNDSSIDIEAELLRRNIMKHSFRIESIDSASPSNSSDNIIDNGLEQLSTTCNTIERLEESLKRLITQWPDNCTTESIKEFKGNDNAMKISKASTSRKAKGTKCAAPSTTKKCEYGPNMESNLRQFLTRELLKYANVSASTSTLSDDSLCSQFLHSVIGSLSPHIDERRLTERKSGIPKTSTPMTSSRLTSDSSSEKRFSIESNISSVKRCSNDDNDCDNQADKSSS